MFILPRIPREFFLDDRLAGLEPLRRILFLGLLHLGADSDGVVADRPRRIQALVLPYDQDADVDRMLDQLVEAGLITRQSGGEPGLANPYIRIEHFETDWLAETPDDE